MTKYQAPFPTKYHLLRLLSAQLPELHLSSNIVRWQHFRLLGTEAARDIPNVDRSKRRIPKEERKILVLTYVNKYRTTNAGKFPSASITMKEVGGSYYTIKSILHELKQKSKLSTVEAPSNNTMVRQTAGVHGIIAEDGSSSQTRLESDLLKIKNDNTSAEALSGSERSLRECGRVSVSDTGKYVKKGQVSASETPSLVEQTSVEPERPERSGYNSGVCGACKTKELGEVAASSEASESKHFSESCKMVELELQGWRMKTSVDDADKCLKSGQVAETEPLILVKQTLLDATIKATKQRNSGDFPRSNHASEVQGTSNIKELGEVDMASSYASESEDASGSRRMIDVKSGQASETETTNLAMQSSVDETIKAMTMKDPENLEILRHASDVCGSCKTKELGKTDIDSSQVSESVQITGDNTVQNPPNSSLWGNLKSFASNVIKSWKKT